MLKKKKKKNNPPDHRERGEIKIVLVKFESSDRVLEPAVRMAVRLLYEA